MGRPFLQYFRGRDSPTKVYCCRACHCPIADADAINNRDFHSKNGRAYLVETAINVLDGPAEDRPMTSGLHLVCDIHCCTCLTILGWKYIIAHEVSQKYKEGQFILERVKIANPSEVASAKRCAEALELQAQQREAAATQAAAAAGHLSGGSSSGSGASSISGGSSLPDLGPLGGSGGGGGGSGGPSSTAPSSFSGALNSFETLPAEEAAMMVGDDEEEFYFSSDSGGGGGH